MLTLTDLFCGAGGSSSGAIQVPGVQVRMAANHWALAVATHNTNHPNTDHDTANISQTEPRRYPGTDLLWASPECTKHSKARGKKDPEPNLFDKPLPKEAEQRSRATMWDVVRFAEQHAYRGIVVENVIDVLEWGPPVAPKGALFQAWLTTLHAMGYRHRLVFLNSMFAGRLGPAAPQSRDRIYVVLWRVGEKVPDLDRWTRPTAWCPRCDTQIRAMQAWKDPRKTTGKYGKHGQYVYRCPNVACRNSEVHPPALPAASVIDWSDLGERIGGRDEPLKPATMARIRRGLARYGSQPLLTPAGGTWNNTAVPITGPMRTRTARETEGVTMPPGALLVPTTGRAGVSARSAADPARTQTSRAETALVVPLRQHGVAQPASSAPLPTFAAAGQHHMLVSYYGNGRAQPATRPVPTIPTRDRFALVSTDVPAIEDCTFRMLGVAEIQAGMAFEPDYQILGTSKRLRIRQLGNAVTPPAARDLIAALTEAITGEEVPA